jgi:hypothetical protein
MDFAARYGGIAKRAYRLDIARISVLGGVAQAGEESVDAFEQRGRVLVELVGGAENGIGEHARLVGGMAGAGHVNSDFAGAGGDLLHAARNLARRRPLLFDGRRDGDRDSADLPDGIADATDGRDTVAGGGLDRGDLTGDLLGGLRGLTGEILDFGCDHGKAPAGFAGAGRLDGRVQRQQIGLAGDCADQAKHIADLLAGCGEAPDHFSGLAGLGHSGIGDVAGMGDLAADLGHRRS